MQTDTNPLDTPSLQAEIEQERQRIEALTVQAQQRLAQLVQQEKDAYLQQQVELRAARDDHRATAKYYRDLAREEPDRARADELVRWAIDAEQNARRIRIDGEQIEPELAPPVPEQPKLAIWQRPRAHLVLMVGQVFLLLFALLVAHKGFHQVGADIATANEQLPFDQRIRPYDLSSWQKFLYGVFGQFADVPITLLKMLILTPFLVWYLYRQFIREFFELLNPFQRCLLLVMVLLGLLLHSSFMGRP